MNIQQTNRECRIARSGKPVPLPFIILYSLFVCSIFTPACSNDNKTSSGTSPIPSEINESTSTLPNTFGVYRFISDVRDNKIDTTNAIDSLRNILSAIKKYYHNHSFESVPVHPGKWKFPLQGYSIPESISEKDKGYIPGRYSFFQGNEHKGHPALDIFIRDKNQDMLDDRTGKEVSVLSVSSGIVLATESDWDSSSALRGGKYIWVYDPGNDYLLYYAHNNRLLVTPGQWLKPGDTIATVGRSGLNAFKQRSPTHLHFMLLKLDSNYYPRPENPFPFLENL